MAGIFSACASIRAVSVEHASTGECYDVTVVKKESLRDVDENDLLCAGLIVTQNGHEVK